MKTRALTGEDWPQAEVLYRELTRAPTIGGAAEFSAVLAHPGTQVFGAFHGARLAAMVTLHLLPNVTYGGRPYGLIENVVTARDLQKQGFGRTALEAAIAAAWVAEAYKIMLLTGQARAAKGFYEAAGFRADDKWGMTLRRDG